jgi:ubiquinone/menaquinone biosynthesis C-methylase UbiE
MASAYSIQGAVLIANVWWYAFSVLRPAQALKPLGLYKSQEIGQRPVRARRPGSGRHYSRKHSAPVLLEQNPDQYHLVVDFDQLATDYDRIVEPFSRPIFEEVIKVLAPLATSRSRILDCSCGPGTEMLMLAELVPDGEVVGSDLAADMVTTAARNARQRRIQNVAFFQADIAALPRHFAGKFDFVYCGLAFHHYPDPLKSVQEMRRVLRPGGHAFIVDAGPWWMKAFGSPLAKWGDPGWVAFRTGEEFQDLFAKAGFSNFYWTEVLPGMGLSVGTR